MSTKGGCWALAEVCALSAILVTHFVELCMLKPKEIHNSLVNCCNIWAARWYYSTKVMDSNPAGAESFWVDNLPVLEWVSIKLWCINLSVNIFATSRQIDFCRDVGCLTVKATTPMIPRYFTTLSNSVFFFFFCIDWLAVITYWVLKNEQKMFQTGPFSDVTFNSGTLSLYYLNSPSINQLKDPKGTLSIFISAHSL